MDAIKSTVKDIEQKMKQVKGLANVKSDLSQTYDQYEIKVDQNKAAENGISASQLAMHLNENLPEKQLRLLKKMVKLLMLKSNKISKQTGQKIS